MDKETEIISMEPEYLIFGGSRFNAEALFCDETENYVIPMEPKPGELVTFRFRTKRNSADKVYLLSGSLRKRMTLKFAKDNFDYYETELSAGSEALRYYFEIVFGKESFLYDKKGIFSDQKSCCPFCVVPGFSTPDWAKGAVMYQIFPERFCNGDPENDVLDREYRYNGAMVCRVKDWDKLPAADGTREFYGGDLQGILDKLDYLQELGVQVLYLNPVFVSPSNHKYDIQDYDYIDPHFGVLRKDEGKLLQEERPDNRNASRYICRVTDPENLKAGNELFVRLSQEIHRRGMRLILDGVFNHCGSFNKWMDRERIYENRPGYEKGAFVAQDSPYHSFFSFHNDQEGLYNSSYERWWGNDTLPKLNYEGSAKLEEYILTIAKKWVSPPYSADGWRLDVAADLGFSTEYNHEFWRKFRRAVKEANPDAIILAEHYGDASGWLAGDQWDTVMNYDAFMEPVTWFFTGMEKHSDDYRKWLLGNADQFMDTMQEKMRTFMAPSLQTAMNELSNHDHSRFLTRTNGKVGRVEKLGGAAASEGVRPEIMREAVLMQMTWPGAPTLYYGDEAGVCGFTDPDSRRTYPWGLEDQQMLEFHRRAIALHKRYPVLTHGSLRFLDGTDNCLAYARFDLDNKIIVIFNREEQEQVAVLPVWQAGVTDLQELTRVFATDEQGFTEEEAIYPVLGGVVTIRLPKTSGVVLEARLP